MNRSDISPDERVHGPHQTQQVAECGAPLQRAKAAMILIHGRGASAASILQLADEFAQEDIAYLAPQAAGNTWYPYSFLAPIDQNEPGLSSGLQAIEDVRHQIESTGIPSDRTIVLGFSQGACLGLEYVARNPRRYGGVVAFSGGLIGTGKRVDAAPPDDKHFEYNGSLDGTPVFLGCSDIDSHIPIRRVQHSAEIMEGLEGTVTTRVYEGMGHTINEDELAFVRSLLAELVESSAP
jgi:predicted esterase